MYIRKPRISGAVLVEARSDGYEDLGERALPSALVVVTSWLAGTLRRAAVNIHCEIASGITTNTLNSNLVNSKKGEQSWT